MKNLYFKYLLMGLWLICYVPFKKSLVLSSQPDAVEVENLNQESGMLKSTWAEIAPVSLSPSPRQAAYQHDLDLSEFSDSPMVYPGVGKPGFSDINRTSSSSSVSRSYLTTTYLLRLSGQKNQYFHLQAFSPF